MRLAVSCVSSKSIMSTSTKTKLRAKSSAPVRHSPASLRLSAALHKSVTVEAAAAGYSLNGFTVAALEGIIEMIHAPDGQMVEPKIVAVARILRKYDRQPVKPRG